MSRTHADNKLSIGIDLSAIWRPRTGIFSYAIQLTRELLLTDEENAYTLFFGGEIHSEFRDLERRFKPVVIPLRDEVISKQLFLAVLCNLHRLDLVHFPAFPPAIGCFRPSVWTLHDATPWLYPETMDLKGRLYFQWVGAWAAQFSRAIITVSHEAKRDIIDALRISDPKVTVIHEGVDRSFRKMADSNFLATVQSRYKLPPRFILTVGTLEPRKNLAFLVETYLRFCEMEPNVGLVIAGRSGWNAPGFQELVARGKGKIIVPGFVPQEDLVALYNLADVFVLASIYEGFGFPPLEAMASGCPVIVSDRGSLPEIVGDAALLIDPQDINSLLSALKQVMADIALRDSLIEKGYRRIKHFSWSQAAIQTLNLYRRAAGRRNEAYCNGN